MQDQISFKSTEEIKPMLKNIQKLVYKRIKKDSSISSLLFLLAGVLNRTYELTDSAIWSIEKRRPFTSAHMARALIETLAFIYYWETEIEKSKDAGEVETKILQALFGSKHKDDPNQQINILTTIDKATKEYSHLRQNYYDISEMVHPNSASHFYFGKATDDKEKLAEFSLPFY